MKASVMLLVVSSLCISLAAHTQPFANTTAGSIAVGNLEQLLGQASEPVTRVDLLLAKSRFLGDYDALSEAEQLAEVLPLEAGSLLLRARTRAAAHRFGDALLDLVAAEQLGANVANVASQRASILVATGRVTDVIAQLESDAQAHPGYATHSALAAAYAELGRYADAEVRYHAAIKALHTSSPFPHAWIHFALGVMWAEQAGDLQRAEIEYDLALQRLPQFAAANIHKAELEVRRGDLLLAQTRLSQVIDMAHEPEALALLGLIRRQRGERDQADRDIRWAGQRFQVLLAREPLAFLDHAAEFYLTVAENPRRAHELAQRNLENRATPRAFALAIRAAAASGLDHCELRQRMGRAFDDAHLSAGTRDEWEKRAQLDALSSCAHP